MFGAIPLAFLAAMANASSSLLQRQANRQRTDKPLITMPVWLAGIGMAIVSFFFQAGALGLGSLAAIEPVLALELVLVVMGSALFFKARIGKQEWLSIIAMVVGTGGLIAALNPQKTSW